MANADEPRPTVLVSSTVYGIEDLLEQVFGILNGLGYEVWMSHKGTMPVDPDKSNFQNCLDAVDQCDLFLGLITPRYGSGQQGHELSITHQELLRAIERDKLRWFLVHEHVVVARQLLRPYRFNEDGSPCAGFIFRPTPILSNIQVIETYEAAMRHDAPLPERTGNWVQSYFRLDDAKAFVTAQFSNIANIRERLAGRARP